MKSNEFKKWLARQGCAFVENKPKGGHITVYLGDKKSYMPIHGAGKELGTGLVNKIKKDLGLK